MSAFPNANEPLTDAELQSAALVGKAMLRVLKKLKVPVDDKRRAMIHAMIVVNDMISEPSSPHAPSS